MIVDVHTHNFETSKYPSIRNLNYPEIEKILSSNEKSFFSVGFHPWYANDYNQNVFEDLRKLATDERVVAIGECGFDKNSEASFERQIHIFKEQIILSESVCKPIIIHCVGCFNELFDLKKKLNPKQKWIIHGFRGKPELAKQALNAGCSLSYGEHYNSDSVRITPFDRLFVETDESDVNIEDLYNRLSIIKLCKVEELIAGSDLLQSFHNR